MPGFEPIIDQDRPVRILTTLLQNGTLPHALLFTGIEGVGKQAAAKALAMACNCKGDDSGCKPGVQKFPANERRGVSARNTVIGACGRCKSCRKIESGNHPDIIQIKPSGAFIKIAQIRELCRLLAMKPYEASTRVVIIRDAQAMNPAAGNALLKMLEEPPERTILILTANQTFDLLPTIVSRCQHIRFNPISKKMLGNALAAEHGIDSADAMAIAAMAGGSFSKALTMCRTNWLQRRNWILKEMRFLSSRPIGCIIALAERITKDKETLADTLEVIKSWLRDLIVAKYCPAKILNQDMARDINLVAQKLEGRSLLSIMETVQATQNRIYANTNLRLTMEVMLLKLARSVGE